VNYIALFILIQAVNLPLMVMGWFICALPYRFVPWIWRNDDDSALIAGMSNIARYLYIAWRNPVGNLRHVPGVSGKGRPLWYWSNVKFYAKAGWLSDGYPCLSFGSGKGY
jgi:hypothetical protein